MTLQGLPERNVSARDAWANDVARCLWIIAARVERDTVTVALTPRAPSPVTYNTTCPPDLALLGLAVPAARASSEALAGLGFRVSPPEAGGRSRQNSREHRCIGPSGVDGSDQVSSRSRSVPACAVSCEAAPSLQIAAGGHFSLLI
jgi:hypothetical protein